MHLCCPFLQDLLANLSLFAQELDAFIMLAEALSVLWSVFRIVHGVQCETACSVRWDVEVNEAE